MSVRGAAIFGASGSPVITGDTELPTAATWLTDVEFILDKETDASLVGEVEVLNYQAIEANIGGAEASTLEGDGGVAISEDRDLDFRFENNEDRRDYYGRLFESDWSTKNWSPATDPNTQVEAPATQDAEVASQEDEEGVLSPLWNAIGWE